MANTEINRKGKPPTTTCAYFGLVRTVIAHPLSILVHLAHQHFPRAKVKSAQVHGAPQVTG